MSRPQRGPEVLALRFAADPRRTARQNFFFDACPVPPDTPMPQDYFLWVVRDGPGTVVVDTGFVEVGSRRGPRRMIRPVAEALRLAGVDPAEVRHLVMTHLHWDHAGGLGLFPRAQVHVQGEEMRFCTGPAMAHQAVRAIYEARDVAAAVEILFQGRLTLHEGDVEIVPGISLHRVGGHTPGSQAVRIATSRGPVVLASDAVHYWANAGRASPFPILASFTDALGAFRRVEALAEGEPERVVPGHDPQVAEVFPAWNGDPHIFCLSEAPIAPIRPLA